MFVPFLFEKLLVSQASLCHALFTPSWMILVFIVLKLILHGENVILLKNIIYGYYMLILVLLGLKKFTPSSTSN